MKKYLKGYAILMIVMISACLSADDWPVYISPGFQIGYSIGEGFFVTTQLTVGSMNFQEYKIINENTAFPGITFGLRHFFSSNQKLYFVDIQQSTAFAGAGIGVGLLSPDLDSSKYELCGRVKMYAGFYGLATADYCFSKNHKKYNFGTILVLPISNVSE